MSPIIEGLQANVQTAFGFFGHIPTIVLVPAVIGAGIAVHLIWTSVYNLYFHPLSSYPGPKLWAIAEVPCALMMVSGEAHKQTLELHKKYGPVVRLGPNWLSYSHPEAFPQIAGHRKPGAGVNEKHDRTWETLRDTIIGAKRENHTRYRKALAHGFTAQAMRDQQPLIMKYADLLVQRIGEHSDGGNKALDMAAWYNWITFDIIGDLTFGEPFGGLENVAYHPWISMLFQALKMVHYTAEARRWKLLSSFLVLLTPASARRKAEEHYNMTAQKVKQRLEMHTDRSDFMDAMTRHKGEKDGMSLSEINATSSVLVTAGSETTATGLAAATFFLCTHPDVLSKLEHEIRTTFKSEAEIDLTSVNQLQYEQAVINETLRTFPPAGGHAIRTINENGDTILGRYLPPGVEVSASYFTLQNDPAYWVEPNSFIPDRWLGDARFAGEAKSTFMPFSIGPRTCLGMNLAYAEMRLILAKIIWNYDMRMDDACKDWVKDARQFLNWEKGPLNVYWTPRKKDTASRAHSSGELTSRRQD